MCLGKVSARSKIHHFEFLRIHKYKQVTYLQELWFNNVYTKICNLPRYQKLKVVGKKHKMPTLKVWFFARNWELGRRQKHKLTTKPKLLQIAINNFPVKMSDEKRFILSTFSKRSTEKYILQIRYYCGMWHLHRF